MKIAIFGTRGIPPRYGGFETFAWHLSKGLGARGHDVTVYGRKGFVGRETLPDGVYSVLTPCLYSKHGETLSHAFTSAYHASGEQYEIGLVCNSACMPVIPLLKRFGMKTILNVDGIEYERRKWGSLARTYSRLCEMGTKTIPDAVIADAMVVQKHYKAKGVETVFIPYGVDIKEEPIPLPRRFYRLQSDRYLLFAARLEPENMAHLVIRAHQLSGLDMPLAIVGHAPYSREYVRMLHKIAGDNVLFLGGVYDEEYRALHNNAFAYIQAGEVGGTHPALLEGMAWSNVVIANDVPQHREVGHDGIVYYRRNDVHDLSAKITMIVEHPDSRSAKSALAQNRLKEAYTWDGVCTSYESLFESLQ